MTLGLIKFWSHTHAKETISPTNKKKKHHIQDEETHWHVESHACQ